MGRGRALRPSSAAQGGLCVGKAPPGPWPGTGCGAPASSPQPCITAGRLQRVAIDREMARRGAAATPATRRAVRLARCAVPRSAKLHYGSPVGARLWVRDFRGFFAGVCARDQGMWPIGPDSRDYEETTFLLVVIEFFVSRSSGSIPAARFVFSTGSIDCRFSVTETERLLVTDAKSELRICRTDYDLSAPQVSIPHSQKRRSDVHHRATSPRGLAAPRASLGIPSHLRTLVLTARSSPPW